MPLPRFERLTPERRESILAVARRAFATDGLEGASYNKIISAAGISKTTAYQYFDDRNDLLQTVLNDLVARLTLVLGRWEPATDTTSFWAELAAASDRLVQHLAEYPDDRALARHLPPDSLATAEWVRVLVADGVRLGVIRTDINQSLIEAATAGVLAAADRWVLAGWKSPARPHHDPTEVRRLLAGLWGTPPEKQQPHRNGQ